MRLSLYVARRFVSLFFRLLAGFFGLMLAIDLVDQIRRFAERDLGMGELLVLSALNVPQGLYRILPLIVMLTAIGLFVALSRSSELVVVRASGRSGLGFLAAPVVAALAIGALAVAVMNPIAAATAHRYQALARDPQAGAAALSIGASGLWLRQGDGTSQMVIHARRASQDGLRLYEVSFQTFDAAGQPLRRIEAESAGLVPGAWVLGPAKAWDLRLDNPETAAAPIAPGQRLATDLTAQAIRDGFGPPSAVSIWDLPAQIDSLQRAGFSARAYLVWFQAELALPLTLAAQVLIAAGFAMRPARVQRLGPLLALAVLCGFAVFFLRNFARVLGEGGQVPIWAAAWTPPVAAMLLALTLLLHLEDG